MRRHRINLALLSVLAVSAPAAAAVRQCGEIVSSAIARAPAEIDAKIKAIDQWHDLALKLGAGYESWRLAADKSLKCVPEGSAFAFACVAVGRPCIISQAPSPGFKPLLPKDQKGQGI